MKKTVQELAELVGGRVVNDRGEEIERIAELDQRRRRVVGVVGFRGNLNARKMPHGKRSTFAGSTCRKPCKILYFSSFVRII